jgi:hypothetical protein
MINNLVGRYRLISHGIYNSEKVFQATSDYLKGELIYSSEHYLSVQIFFKEIFESTRDILAYSGKYEIVSSLVVEHHIEICSQAKKDNTVENRNYRIEENFLFLSISYDDGSMFEAQWKKME